MTEKPIKCICGRILDWGKLVVC